MEIYFAPLQGFTDFVYRNFHAKYFSGVDKYFTPFLRVEKNDVRKKDKADLINSLSLFKSSDSGIELVPQIIVNCREDVEILVQFVGNQGFKACDLNFGCPFPQQSHHFYGAGIWDKPEKVCEVFEALKLFPEISFSLKMRLGNTSLSQTVDLLDVINSADFRFVTVHPRLAKQMYSGEIDFQGFEVLYSKIKKPIVFNGDLLSVQDIEAVEKKYPDLKAVMIGRGLLRNPFLAENFKNKNSTFDKQRFLNFQNALIEGYLAQYQNSEFMVLDKMKTFWQFSDADSKMLKRIKKAKSISEYISFSAMAVSEKK